MQFETHLKHFELQFAIPNFDPNNNETEKQEPKNKQNIQNKEKHKE